MSQNDKLNNLEYKLMQFEKNVDAFKDNNDFWTNWENFRNFITHVINKHIVNEYDFKTLAIWGAGRCKDIDLSFFCENFEEVNLFDIKRNDVIEGVKAQNLSQKQLDKIKIHESFDFLDVEDIFYIELKDMFKNKSSVKSITKFIRKQANKVNIQTSLSKVNKQFDVSISLGVHSQLFSDVKHSFDEYLNLYNDEDVSKIGAENRYLHKIGASLYNQFLYNTVRDGGAIFVGFDLIEFSPYRGTLELLDHFKILMAKGEIFEHLDSFLKLGAVLGAYDGYYDFTKSFKDEAIKFPTNFAIWDYFDFHSYFFMTTGIIK
ncbi:MAG: hypothetical protein BGO41_01355 [Clostridiales bacterium 38-18]|nr:MAG: hypothetical protein BGO41_01355 [Clostridiales bacterium 38-18]